MSIRYGDRGPAKEPAVTIVEMFEDVVRSHGDNIALAVKRLGEWQTWTYKTYRDEARSIARAFICVSDRFEKKIEDGCGLVGNGCDLLRMGAAWSSAVFCLFVCLFVCLKEIVFGPCIVYNTESVASPRRMAVPQLVRRSEK